MKLIFRLKNTLFSKQRYQYLLTFLLLFFSFKELSAQNKGLFKPQNFETKSFNLGLAGRSNLRSSGPDLNINGVYVGYNYNQRLKTKLVASSNVIQYRFRDKDVNEKLRFYSIGEEALLLRAKRVDFLYNVLMGIGNLKYQNNETKNRILPLEMGLLVRVPIVEKLSFRTQVGYRHDLAGQDINALFLSLSLNYKFFEKLKEKRSEKANRQAVKS